MQHSLCHPEAPLATAQLYRVVYPITTRKIRAVAGRNRQEMLPVASMTRMSIMLQ
jgi:hypothetical protein